MAVMAQLTFRGHRKSVITLWTEKRRGERDRLEDERKDRK